jgi:hypothetical protein
MIGPILPDGLIAQAAGDGPVRDVLLVQPLRARASWLRFRPARLG